LRAFPGEYSGRGVLGDYGKADKKTNSIKRKIDVRKKEN